MVSNPHPPAVPCPPRLGGSAAQPKEVQAVSGLQPSSPGCPVSASTRRQRGSTENARRAFGCFPCPTLRIVRQRKEAESEAAAAGQRRGESGGAREGRAHAHTLEASLPPSLPLSSHHTHTQTNKQTNTRARTHARTPSLSLSAHSLFLSLAAFFSLPLPLPPHTHTHTRLSPQFLLGVKPLLKHLIVLPARAHTYARSLARTHARTTRT